MISRFKELLSSLKLSSAEFADRIGVQRSSVSHVLSGRNKPSIDFLEKMLLAFPGINAGWLITGKGSWSIEKSEERKPINEEMSSEEAYKSDKPGEKKEEGRSRIKNAVAPGSPSESQIKTPALGMQGPVDHIIIVYTDNTFRILNPGD